MSSLVQTSEIRTFILQFRVVASTPGQHTMLRAIKSPKHLTAYPTLTIAQ